MFLFFLTSGLFLGWSLGANDAANIFGSAVGSRMIKFKQAAIIASIFVILGSVIQGEGAAHTLGKLGSVNALGGAFTVAFAAGLTVFWMTKLKLPVSTSQAIVGAIIGWNFFSGNPTDLHSLQKIVGTWIFGPILGGIFAILLFLLLKIFLKKSNIHIIKLDAYIKYALLIVGAFGAYSLGANNIANVVGVFIPSVPEINLNFGFFQLDGVNLLFLAGSAAIAIGIITYSKKVMLTVGRDLMKLSSETAIVVVLAQALVLFVFSSQTLSNFSQSIGLPPIPLVPVSSSQAIIGAIIGIGLLKGGRNIEYSILGKISLGWVATPVIAGIVSFISLFVFSNVFNIKVVDASKNIANKPVLDSINLSQEVSNKALDINLFNPFLFTIIAVLFILVVYFIIRNIKNKEKLKIAQIKENENNYIVYNELLEKDIEINKTEKTKLESELKFKKNELMNIAIKIINLNEFLEKLTTEINLIKNKKEEDIGHKDLNKLLLLITNSIDLKQDRKTLNLYIDELNSSFYFRLDNKFPKLTNNEKKLCSLLRLNLTSKQISSLLNISPKSVEVNRYRLRQKLKVSHKDKLTDIINSI